MPGPLDGIRILDFCVLQNGGYATAMLADMGAEVVKIEDPVKGDPARAILGRGRAAELGIGAYFEANNRNKKAMTLDLKKEKGREVFYRLVEKADVVATNLRVHVPRQLGFDYETLVKHNPRIIFAHSTGYGRHGPDAGEMVYDLLGLARGGMTVSMTVPGEPPVYTSGGIADQVGAMMLAHAIVLALFARERTGRGQRVDVSQLGSVMMLQGLGLYTHAVTGSSNPPYRPDKAGNPLYSYHRGQDGRWFALSCPQPDRFWGQVCDVLGMQRIKDDPRFATLSARSQHTPELIRMMDEAIATRPAAEWVQRFKGCGIPATLVQDYSDLFTDPQVVANNYVVDFEHPVIGKLKIPGIPIQLGATPGEVRTAGPQYGEHTHEVLLAAGYSWDDIASFHDEGVI